MKVQFSIAYFSKYVVDESAILTGEIGAVFVHCRFHLSIEYHRSFQLTRISDMRN